MLFRITNGKTWGIEFQADSQKEFGTAYKKAVLQSPPLKSHERGQVHWHDGTDWCTVYRRESDREKLKILAPAAELHGGTWLRLKNFTEIDTCLLYQWATASVDHHRAVDGFCRDVSRKTVYGGPRGIIK